MSSFTLTRHGGDDTIDGKDDAPRSQRRGGLCVGGDWGPLAVAGAITTVSDDELIIT